MKTIYEIRNTITNEFYIGKTSKTTTERLKKHYQSRNEKGRVYATPIRKSMRKYQLDDFEIRVLAIVCDDKADEHERSYIEIYREDGYAMLNVANGGDGGDTLSNHPDIREIGAIISSKLTGAANAMSKPCVAKCTESGSDMVFESASLCSKHFGVSATTIKRKCNGVTTDRRIKGTTYIVEWKNECND